MKNRRMTVPWKTLLLLGSALGWPSLSQAASCTISPQNPSLSTGGSVTWSASYTGFRRSPRYSWTFSEGQPSSSESSRPVTVTYPQAGTFTTSLRLGREETTATCSTSVTVGTQDTQAPSTPSGLVASAAGASQINLTWSASTDNVGVTGYQVFRCQGSSCTPTAQIGTTPTPSYSDSGLAVNTTYGYRVRAIDAAGNLSDYSNIATATTGGTTGGTGSNVSINSTSQSCGLGGQSPACSGTAVTQQPAPTSNNSLSPAPGTGLTNYQIVAVNDLGMHCGDLDTRILSILPPYNVLNARVIEKPTTSGGAPTPLTDADVEVFYSAGSSSTDPVLDPNYVNPQGYDAPTGSVFKTNYWDVARTAYAPFYPPTILPDLYPTSLDIADVGLAVPDLELWYLDGNGNLLPSDQWGINAELDQQTMPAITTFTLSSTAVPPYQPTDIASAPYSANQPQKVELYVSNWPLFSANFGTDIGGFGYEATNVDWFVAEGVPMSVYDDLGLANAYPLMRMQAKAAPNNSLGLAAGTVLATVDTVAPISAEANCQGCHGDPLDPNYVAGNQTVAGNIASYLETANPSQPLVTSDQDPEYGTVPTAVSFEWASDRNILRLHDYNEGVNYPDTSGNVTTNSQCDLASNPATTSPNCLVNQTPVVCQSCHYTPALDLLQVGPNGPGGPLQAYNQAYNQSMSRVMHNFHGLRTADGMSESSSSTGLLFPYMPPPVDPVTGIARDPQDTRTILEQTCYECHPGKHAKCLRGAMANADVVCQDCHGQMTQVGDDFSRNLPGGSFIYASDFYDPGSSTPRVPWVNEPSCGSCHTGDYNGNLAGTTGTVVNTVDTYNNVDGIRLKQAYPTGSNCTTQAPGDCPKWTPIVPTNKRFAEDVIDPTAAPGTPGGANPKLYRVSVGGETASGSPSPNGHRGLFCEACHGPTHAEWPVTPSSGTFIANDNQTALQLQGHTGPIAECSTCHGTTDLGSTLGGPHGMHPVGNTSFARGGHENLAQSGACVACHGANATSSGRSQNVGTVLSRAAATRTISTELGTVTIQQGQVVGCSTCHSGSGGG